ncbi:MAG: hypothetical protein B7Z37_06680 [Verrucomicrobia bacterium 12-59-8]|nr:MAG: hypothetical protein B7Z37_06680 [Verrucomicrobia bacterium 12-59-8]
MTIKRVYDLGLWIVNNYFMRFFRLFKIDFRSFVLGRFLLGMMVVIDSLLRSVDLAAHYSDDGFLPRHFRMLDMHPFEWSLHLANGSVEFAGLLVLVMCAAGVCLAFGYQRRWATFVTWLLLTSLCFRTPSVCTGGDSILRLLLFWSFFVGPGFSSKEPKTALDPQPCYLDVGTFCLLFQICSIYWVTALLKYHSVWRTEGTALEWTLGIESFQGPLANSALQYPLLLKVLTFATLRVEELAPFFALLPFRFGRTRTVAVLSMIVFHLFGIALTLRLGTFPWISAISWVFFLPPYFWDRLEKSRLLRWSFTLHPQQASQNGGDTFLGHAFLQTLALLLVAYTTWWNISAVAPVSWGKLMPAEIRTLGYSLGIGQNWFLFAPRPATRDGWYVSEALLKDGSVVDPLHDGAPVSFEKPSRGLAAEYPNSRTQRFFHSMFYTRQRGQLLALGDGIIRSWNATHDNSITKLSVYFMLQDHWHPEDGIRKIKVFPVEATDDEGHAIFPDDLRWKDPSNS